MSVRSIQIVRGIIFFGVLGSFLFLQSCSLLTSSPQSSGAPAPAVAGDVAAAAEEYRIDAGDVLSINVYGEEGLNQQELVVRPDGKVSFPLIGDVEVGGLTTTQVKEIVEKRVREYVPEANVAVGVKQLGSLQYYIVGKVQKPGMYNVSKTVTVLQALSLAGGLTTFADEKHIQIVRNKDGRVLSLPFNYTEVRKGRNLEQNIVLERGDTILVP